MPRHVQAPTSRFSGRAGQYHLSRPRLPGRVIDTILDGFDLRRCVVVDFGSGTGLAAEQVAERLEGDAHVIAIEPNDDMRDSGTRHARVRWRSATAEQTGLADRTADIVMSVTAFHWFDPRVAPAETARLLVPGGRLAVFATDRDPADEVESEFHRIIGDAQDAITPENIDRWYGHAFLAGHYGPVKRVVEENPQSFDLARLMARAESSSYWPVDSDSRSSAAAAVEGLWRRHRREDGFLHMRYRTVGLVANRRD